MSDGRYNGSIYTIGIYGIHMVYSIYYRILYHIYYSGYVALCYETITI